MTETKQCADPSDKGCGEVKPLSEFKSRRYLKKDGSRSMSRDKRCRECVNRNTRNGKPGVKTPVYHEGPDKSSLEYFYFCMHKFPSMSRDLRESRRVRA